MGTFDNLTQEEKKYYEMSEGLTEGKLKQWCDAYDEFKTKYPTAGISFEKYLPSRLCGLNDGEIIQYAEGGSLKEFLEPLEEDGDSDTSKTYGIPNRSIAYPFQFKPEQLQDIYQKDGGICKGCGKKLTIKDATIDHITPLAVVFNSTDDISYERRYKEFFDPNNLQLMCRNCNSEKGSRGVVYKQSKILKILQSNRKA